MFRVRDLRKSFDRARVLKGLTLDFPVGSTTVVLGPSGCGKSVLLKHLVGLLRPDRGEVWFEDTRVDTLDERRLDEVRRQVGFLFQQGALFDSLDVAGNLAFPLLEHGITDPEEVAARSLGVLREVGLEHVLRQMPADLSGGQRKRVALARAIVLEPRAVLYDEPTTGLDPIRSDIINELILKLAQTRQITSIVVTHDLASAFKVGTRFILLDAGLARFCGSAEELRAAEDPVVRRFLAGEASPEELAQVRGSGEDARR